MLSEIKDRIHSLVAKYDAHREFYLTSRFNETEARSQFLDPLFEILGWDIKNNAGKSTSEREVLLEEPLKNNTTSYAKKPDYTFRLFSERKFFVEAKKPCVNIEIEDDPAKQVRRYGYSAGLKISVLSNFEYLFIYDTSYPVEENDTRTKARVNCYHYTEYEDKIDELLLRLGKESVYSGMFDEIWQNIELNVSHQSIDKLFLKQINEWRLMLGKQIKSLLPNMDLIELGDIVQSYINKILFLRVCEDRNIETYQRLLQIAEQSNGQELIEKFKSADRRYNSGLFAERLSEDIVCNLGSTFWIIIRQLYYPESPYSFSVLSSDILGRIYEIFIAQRFAITDEELTIINKPENEERDIVTTPTYIVREILAQTIGTGINEIGLTQLSKLKFADIACGSGAFLLELYQLLQDKLVDYYVIHDKRQLIQTSIDTYKLHFETKKNLLLNCIYGVDKDYNAVEACKFGLLLKLLEGEDVVTLAAFHPILPSLDNNIFFGNSLLSSTDITKEQHDIVNPFDFGRRKFDFVIGNPPYMKTEDVKNITPVEYNLYPLHYSSAYKQYDKYFLFIERAFQLLTPNGRLGFIVPSKFMKVGAAVKLRKLISDGKKVVSLTSFGAHQVFSDKSTYSCIIILQNQKNDIFSYTEIENFKAWRVRDQESYSICKREADCIGKDTWVLCTDKHKPLLDKILCGSIPLGGIVGSDYIFNGIQTSANKVYVFTPLREDRKYYYFKAFNKQEYQIERAITKPYFQTIQGAGALNSYRTFEPNARVVFPYKKSRSGKLALIQLSTIQRDYPYFYKYLMDAKGELAKPSRDIKPTPNSQDEWYRYGRQQSLEACEVDEKMIIGVLSQAEKYAIDNRGTLVSSGGTAGYCVVCVPTEEKYSIYYIQAILGSVQGEWLASLYGEIFRGGYIARGTKVLKQIPIRTIDFGNEVDVKMHDDIVNRQKHLISIGDKLAKVANNPRKAAPIQRQFDMLKEEQQNVINGLYGMSKEEQRQIPLIKEIYAVD
jgi:type I restriction-modification system DNA methylase subunit